MSWLYDHFGTDKPIIAVLHIRAMPGSPRFGKEDVGTLREIIDIARRDLNFLQAGGVDAIDFANEYDIPRYGNKEYPNHKTAIMSRIIGEIYNDIRVPYGVNIASDVTATLDLAKATESTFIRSTISGAFAGVGGITSNDYGPVSRHQMYLGLDDLKIFTSMNPERCKDIVERSVEERVRSLKFNCAPAGICVGGAAAGTYSDVDLLKEVKKYAGDTPVMCNTGMRAETVADLLEISDGGFVGTTFKKNGEFFETVDPQRVKDFMAAAKKARGSR